MINPPLGPSSGGPLFDEPGPPGQPQEMAPAQGIVTYSIIPEQMEQDEIVKIANGFKKSTMQHAKSRKQEMKRCYAYIKGQFMDGDLLPRPSSGGSDKDAATNRPQIFMPLSRQQYKQLKSQLRLNIFPNDEDYFRVRAKTDDPIADPPPPQIDQFGNILPPPQIPSFTDFEDPLTEGLKYVFKEAHISQKIGANLDNVIWAGCFAAFPTVQDRVVPEWRFNMEIPGYEKINETSLSELDVEVFSPIDFYVDPSASNNEYGKWVYVGRKKGQEIRDSKIYFNKEKISQYESKQVDFSNKEDGLSIHGLHDLNSTFEDSEGNLKYDLYYFPYLKTKTAEYRNMILGVVDEKCLVRFHPNTTPKGKNPVVFTDWDPEMENPYSQSPIEDIKDIQRLINIMENYKVETLARIGNRFAVSGDVDIDNLFGIAGGVLVGDEGRDIRQQVMALTGDYQEIAAITNDIGVLKAEAQIVSGAQNPFQGASNIDFKKTATEINRLTENSISILREVIDHLCVMGVSKILERLMYLVADMYNEPIKIPVDRPFGGREYITVDFSLLKSGQYVIELMNINPSQSKQVQIDGLMKLLELFTKSDANTMQILEPLIVKIGELWGLKNVRDILDEVKQRFNAVTQIIPGVPALPPGAQPGAVPGMAGVSQATPGEQGPQAA